MLKSAIATTVAGDVVELAEVTITGISSTGANEMTHNNMRVARIVHILFSLHCSNFDPIKI